MFRLAKSCHFSHYFKPCLTSKYEVELKCRLFLLFFCFILHLFHTNTHTKKSIRNHIQKAFFSCIGRYILIYIISETYHSFIIYSYIYIYMNKCASIWNFILKELIEIEMNQPANGVRSKCRCVCSMVEKLVYD